MNLTLQLDLIPEELREALETFSTAKPDWPIERVFCAAMSLFLMQNGVENRSINRLYIDSVFAGQKWQSPHPASTPSPAGNSR